MKYSEILNVSSLVKKLERMSPENVKEFYNLKCVVTEKIHGENFRAGVDKNGVPFIGQRNNVFYKFEKHPHYSQFSDKLKDEINRIIGYCVSISPYLDGYEITFFGELHGKGLQKGFTYPFDDGLRVRWFDVGTANGYFGYKEKIKLFDLLNLEGVAEIGQMTMSEALKLDVENISSKVANEPYIEGIVITPIQIHDWWRFQNRLIVKYKTKRFTEENQGKHKKEKPINSYISPFVDFVTEARIEHAIQSLQEKGVEIFYEMKDLQYIPREVIADIEKEENEGQPLSKEDRKYLGFYIPKFYKKYLEQEYLEQEERK